MHKISIMNAGKFLMEFKPISEYLVGEKQTFIHFRLLRG